MCAFGVSQGLLCPDDFLRHGASRPLRKLSEREHQMLDFLIEICERAKFSEVYVR